MVASSDCLPGLKARAGDGAGEVLAFTDAEALTALQTIMKRRPQLVALERMFAVTPRGAALINRIKADPKLRDAEIRVMAHNSDYTRVVPRAAPPGAPALDQRGTRRAPRFRMADKTLIVLDGKSGTIVDLSTVGAQVVSPGALKPNQRISVALPRRRRVRIQCVGGVDVVRNVGRRRAALSRRAQLRRRRSRSG